MDRLYEAGVIYGVSLTATRENAEEILSDEFIEFLFHKKTRRHGLDIPVYAHRSLLHAWSYANTGTASANVETKLEIGP